MKKYVKKLLCILIGIGIFTFDAIASSELVPVVACSKLALSVSSSAGASAGAGSGSDAGIETLCKCEEDEYTSINYNRLHSIVLETLNLQIPLQGSKDGTFHFFLKDWIQPIKLAWTNPLSIAPFIREYNEIHISNGHNGLELLPKFLAKYIKALESNKALLLEVEVAGRIIDSTISIEKIAEEYNYSKLSTVNLSDGIFIVDVALKKITSELLPSVPVLTSVKLNFQIYCQVPDLGILKIEEYDIPALVGDGDCSNTIIIVAENSGKDPRPQALGMLLKKEGIEHIFIREAFIQHIPENTKAVILMSTNNLYVFPTNSQTVADGNMRHLEMLEARGVYIEPSVKSLKSLAQKSYLTSENFCSFVLPSKRFNLRDMNEEKKLEIISFADSLGLTVKDLFTKRANGYNAWYKGGSCPFCVAKKYQLSKKPVDFITQPFDENFTAELRILVINGEIFPYPTTLNQDFVPGPIQKSQEDLIRDALGAWQKDMGEDREIPRVMRIDMWSTSPRYGIVPTTTEGILPYEDSSNPGKYWRINEIENYTFGLKVVNKYLEKDPEIISKIVQAVFDSLPERLKVGVKK